MNSLKTLVTAAAFSTLTLSMTLTAFASGTAGGPDSTPAPTGDENREAIVNAFIDSWSTGAPTADLNGDGGVDGADLERFMRALDHPRSRADLTGDGLLDRDDYLAFLSMWSAGDSIADLNRDGAIDGGDLEEFLLCFNSPDFDLAPWTTGTTDLPRGGGRGDHANTTDDR